MVYFEWDKRKAEANERNHSVTFDEAADMLLGDYVAFRANVKGESRFKAIARIRGEYFAIVYTERGNAIRIISARHATPREGATYEKHIDR